MDRVCLTQLVSMGRMKKENRARVTLEPELEQEAALWSPERRRAAANKMERWVRQLRISAAIMERDRQVSPPKLRVVRLRVAVLN